MTTRLGDVARIVDCEHMTAPREDHDPYAFSIGTSSVRDGKIHASAAKPVSRATFERWTRRAVPTAEDLIFSREAPMGEVGQVPRGLKVCLGQRTVLLRLDRTRVTPQYVLYALQTPITQRWVRDNAMGSTVQHLNVADVRRIPLPPLPPLAEQRRIVEILEEHLSHLDAADALLTATGTRVSAWESAMRDEAVNSAGAERTPLSNLVTRVEAGRSFGGPGGPAAADEWGIIKVSAMTWGEFRPDQNKRIPDDGADPRYEIKAGDLLVSRANTSAYVGAPVLVRKTLPKLLLSDKSLRIVPRRGVSAEWLSIALASRSSRAQISAQATGTSDSMRNISQRNLLSILVPTADADQQERTVVKVRANAEIAHRVLAQISSVRVRSATLRRSVLSAAFSGRLTGRSNGADLIEEMASA